MSDIAPLLSAYLGYFERYAPTQLSSITPATATQLDDFEAELGASLPGAYRDLLTHADKQLFFDENFELLSLDRAREVHQRMNRLLEEGVFDDGRIEHHKAQDFGNWDGGFIQEVWWHPLWVPFAYDGCGNMKCIDLAPGEHGHAGQIVAMEVQDGQGPFIERNYSDILDYIEAHVRYLREGRVMIDAEPGGNWIYIDHGYAKNPDIWKERG